MTINAKNIESSIGGAGIGAGEDVQFNPSLPSGSILFKDQVKIRAHSDGGAGIGAGYNYYAYNGDFELGSITIQDSADIYATTRGLNSSAIGTSHGAQMMQINISGNATVKAIAHADYDEEKYPENAGFGNFEWVSAGAGIGVSSQSTYAAESSDIINISGNPTIIAGGNAGGICIPNGNLNISGGTIKTFICSGLGIGIDNYATNLVDGLTAAVNISGENTKIDVLAQHTVTQEDKDSNPAVFNGYEVGDLYSTHYGAGIGFRVKATFSQPTVTISEATVNILSTKGAGIGYAALDGTLTNGTIIINKNANVKTSSTNGAAIGTGQQTKGSLDIVIENATVEASSLGSGSGIGSGLYAGYNMPDEKPQVSLNATNAKIKASSVSGAGIGSGVNSPTQLHILLKDSDVSAISSTSGAGIGGGRYTAEYPSYAGEIIIDGGTVLAQSYAGAGIGGGQRYDSKDQTPRDILTDGTLEIKNGAEIIAYSGGLYSPTENDDGIISHHYYRDAITAKLLPGSMRVMQSHTMEPSIDRSHALNIQSFNSENDTPVVEMVLPAKLRSYAYSIPDDSPGSTYTERAIDKDGTIFEIIQYENEDLSIA